MSHTWGVGELTRTIDRVLRRQFSDEIWVSGEIAGIDRSGAGHVYLRLVDPDPDRPAGSRADPALSVTLFDSTRRAVNAELQRAGVGRISEGMGVRVRGRIQLYAPSGRVQLRMTGIDAAFTLGALEAARDRLLAALAAEGLTERNGSLDVPPLPLRVGLVTSGQSAASADFLAELRASRIGFTVVHCDTRVQGPEAASGVRAAIRTVVAHGVDVVAVVRGGGDRLDLAAFDSEVIARAIATCPSPVWCGIGHEIDRSVADVVAHRSFKTPTAVAAALVEQVRLVRAHLERAQAQVHRSAERVVERERNGLDARASRVRRAAAAAAERAGSRLELAEARLAAVDPRRAAARGWVVLRDDAGSVVRRVADVEVGDVVSAALSDGTLRATVVARDGDGR